MAGLPAPVTERASALLEQHVSVQRRVAETPASYVTVSDDIDRSGPEIMRREERELALDLAAANIAAMTPIEAINALFALQQRALALLRAAGEGE
jgi:hypothetical protein